MAEDPTRAGRLPELVDVVSAHARAGDDKGDRIARVDHVRKRRGRVIARDAHDRAVDGQVPERGVEQLDGLALRVRILRVARLVDPFVVDVDERVACVEPFADEINVHVRVLDGRKADAASQSAQEGGLGRERAAEAMPLEKRGHLLRPSEPLQRDDVEPLALEPAHDGPRPVLACVRRPLRFGDDRLRAQHRIPRTEERVGVCHAVVRTARDPQNGLAAPDVREREMQTVDGDVIAARDERFGFRGVALRIGTTRQPPAVLAPLSRAQRRVGEDVLGAHVLAATERLEDGPPRKLVRAIAEHRPVRHLARRRAPGPDRIQHAARS